MLTFANFELFVCCPSLALQTGCHLVLMPLGPKDRHWYRNRNKPGALCPPQCEQCFFLARFGVTWQWYWFFGTLVPGFIRSLHLLPWGTPKQDAIK